MSIKPIERRINWTQLNAIEWLRFDCWTQSKLNRILPRIRRSIVECNRINRTLRQISVWLIRFWETNRNRWTHRKFFQNINARGWVIQANSWWIEPIKCRQSIERIIPIKRNRTPRDRPFDCESIAFDNRIAIIRLRIDWFDCDFCSLAFDWHRLDIIVLSFDGIWKHL